MQRLAILLVAIACQAQTWSAITPGGTALRANGFYNKLLWDPVNGEMLYFGHPSTVSSIYQSALYGYSTVTHNWTLRVDNGATDQHCAQEGSPYDAFNPLNGHQQGYFWYDTTHGQAQMTGQLCQSQFMGYTGFYRSATMDMGTALAKAPFATGDGTFNATMVNFQNIDWIAGYGKAVYCCYAGSATNLALIEFNGVDTWTDITGSVTGDTPTQPLTGAATMSDGTNLWVLAGCHGASPGNFAPNTCADNTNDLYKYVASTKVFTLIAPVGGVKPPTTNGSFPFAYYDSLRGRIVWYAGTNNLWWYTVATNTWTEVTTTGGFTIPSMGSVGPDGNMAQYDPVHDVGVFMYPVGGGGAAPLVYHLQFPPQASGLSGAVKFSGSPTIR